ncbi:MAG: hypothetical protein B0W54_01365 [Cellvibrio sp. 79]|nr:MAG: hypothetical protein B0W54_01365 [Cellvibrio sp. 79]
MHTSKTIILLTMFFSALSSAECLKDGQDVTFMGTISRETFPGPPNYESIDDGDAPETYWVLTISTPQCVTAESMESDTRYEVAKSTTRFQLAFEDANIYKSQKNLVENSAVVEGQLFAGHSGHHHTKVLISVKSIKPVIQ